jgi:hypothetical protein
MTTRRLSAFIDALAAGRRGPSFRADPADAALLRTAIELRAARPGDATPDEQFVAELHQTLADQARLGTRTSPLPTKTRRRPLVLAAVAAAVVLVGGTAVATETVDRAPATPAAVPVPHGQDLRTGTFETADGRVMGQIVAYRGRPSWVFMNVDGTSGEGPITCELQVEDGSTVATGTFALHGGSGEFSKAIQVDISHLRGAKLITANGTIVASATFA